MTISPLGDSAVVIAMGETLDPAAGARVRALANEFLRRPLPGMLDVVPAFASIAIYFDPTEAGGFESLRAELEARLASPEVAAISVEGRRVEIPVCYGGELGPDLEHVATHAGLTAAATAALHARAEYWVEAIGFAPGFPYLGGLPAALAVPRRAAPRPRVPAGSVGIGGTQTGVYPISTPGGWNLIGRTPLRLFDPDRAEPSLLRAGDRVTFRAICPDEFDRWCKGGVAAEADLSSANTSAGRQGGTRVTNEGGGAFDQGSGTSGGAAPGIEVVRAGMFTTVQDRGRPGHRSEGIPLGGAVDPFALRLANALVGNPEGAAGLEFTLIGPELRFLHDTVIALAGGEFGDVPCWQPVAVGSGTTVKLSPARSGCRGYLAVAGGIDVAPVLGSRSTYARGELGGFQGRALREGDVLPVPAVRRQFRHHWRIDARILPEYSAAPIVRVIPAEHAGEFAESWEKFSFTVSPQSDRMGVRLVGPALQRSVARDLVSGAVAPGTVQVPPNGQPIILLADAQTIGGYPQLAHVISVDLPLIAQLRPGDTVRFRVVTLAEAQERITAQAHALALLREGLAQKLA